MRVLKAQKSFTEAANKEGKDLPAEMLSNAEKRKEVFLNVKTDIDSKMMIIHTNLDEVKALFKGNIQSTDNPAGVFTQGEEKYLECLELGHVKLEDLMRNDEAHCEEILVMIKR